MEIPGIFSENYKFFVFNEDESRVWEIQHFHKPTFCFKSKHAVVFTLAEVQKCIKKVVFQPRTESFSKTVMFSYLLLNFLHYRSFFIELLDYSRANFSQHHPKILNIFCKIFALKLAYL
mgnify:CR=1 FL=1